MSSGTDSKYGWNEDFIQNYWPAIIGDSKVRQGGGSKSGTGLAALYDQFHDLKVTPAALQGLVKMGMIADASKLEYNKKGEIKGKGTAEIINKKELRENPATWSTERFMPKIEAKRGKKFSDDPDLAREELGDEIGTILSDLGKTLSNRVAKDTVAGMIIQRGERERDARITRKMPGLEGLKILDDAPVSTLQSFSAGFTDLLAALAAPAVQPALAAMKTMGDAFRSFTGWQRENPEAGAAVSAGATAAAGAGAVGATVAARKAWQWWRAMPAPAAGTTAGTGATAAAEATPTLRPAGTGPIATGTGTAAVAEATPTLRAAATTPTAGTTARAGAGAAAETAPTLRTGTDAPRATAAPAAGAAAEAAPNLRTATPGVAPRAAATVEPSVRAPSAPASVVEPVIRVAPVVEPVTRVAPTATPAAPAASVPASAPAPPAFVEPVPVKPATPIVPEPASRPISPIVEPVVPRPVPSPLQVATEPMPGRVAPAAVEILPKVAPAPVPSPVVEPAVRPAVAPAAPAAPTAPVVPQAGFLSRLGSGLGTLVSKLPIAPLAAALEIKRVAEAKSFREAMGLPDSEALERDRPRRNAERERQATSFVAQAPDPGTFERAARDAAEMRRDPEGTRGRERLRSERLARKSREPEAGPAPAPALAATPPATATAQALPVVPQRRVQAVDDRPIQLPTVAPDPRIEAKRREATALRDEYASLQAQMNGLSIPGSDTAATSLAPLADRAREVAAAIRDISAEMSSLSASAGTVAMHLGSTTAAGAGFSAMAGGVDRVQSALDSIAAGAAAAGETMRTSLNITATPTVDSSSIATAIGLANQLRAALAGANVEAAGAASRVAAGARTTASSLVKASNGFTAGATAP